MSTEEKTSYEELAHWPWENTELTTKLVDKRSVELIEEFKEHYASCLDSSIVSIHGGDVDKNKVFHSWAIQKIASLQLLVFRLNQVINAHHTRLGILEGKRR